MGEEEFAVRERPFQSIRAEERTSAKLRVCARRRRGEVESIVEAVGGWVGGWVWGLLCGGDCSTVSVTVLSCPRSTVAGRSKTEGPRGMQCGCGPNSPNSPNSLHTIVKKTSLRSWCW